MEKRNRVMLSFPLLGAVGFILRLIQNITGFEPSTGLPFYGNPAAILLIMMMAAIPVYAAATLWIIPVKRERRTIDAVYGRPTASLWFVAGLMTAAMGILHMIPLGERGTGNLALGIAALVSAPYLMLSSHGAIRLRVCCYVEGTSFYLFWLVMLFSYHSTDPVRIAFAPALLALCAASLAFCSLTMAACGAPRHRTGRCALLAGTALCIIAAADGCSIATLPALPGFLAAALMQFDMAWES